MLLECMAVFLLAKLRLVKVSQNLLFSGMNFIVWKYTTLLPCHRPELKRMQITLILLKVIPCQVITVSIQGLTLPKGFWQNKFSMAFKQIADANNSVAFIRNVSENWKTSIINHSYIKHWLTLLWVNYKHWPWSLLPFEDFCHSTLFSTMCDRLNASYAFD